MLALFFHETAADDYFPEMWLRNAISKNAWGAPLEKCLIKTEGVLNSKEDSILQLVGHMFWILFRPLQALHKALDVWHTNVNAGCWKERGNQFL